MSYVAKNKYRYCFEHKFIPLYFFEQCQPFIQVLLEQRGKMFVDLYESMGSSCPYTASDFVLKPMIVSGHGIPGRQDFAIIQVEMPAPEEMLQCKRVYICHDASLGTPAYFTLEKDDSCEYCLCEWTSTGAHFNYGDCSGDEKTSFYKVMGIYSERVWPSDSHTIVS